MNKKHSNCVGGKDIEEIWESNKAYHTLLKLEISCGQTLSIKPIITEFLERKIYKIQYSITGEDFKIIKRNFLIKAIK